VFEGNHCGAVAVENFYGPRARFERCVFTKNWTGNKGTIRVDGSSIPATFDHCLVYDNTDIAMFAQVGIFWLQGFHTTEILNCTIVRNLIKSPASAAIMLVSGAVPRITNCIIRENTSFGVQSSITQIRPLNSVYVTYSLVEGGYGSLGFASTSNLEPFLITATKLINGKSGLLLYGTSSQAVAFQGGVLCVAAPIRRTALISSGGTPWGINCTGGFSFDFNAHIASGADPVLQVPGTQVYAQYWSRDPWGSFDASLTDALQFQVCQ
jgi:hypothetical protein